MECSNNKCYTSAFRYIYIDWIISDLLLVKYQYEIDQSFNSIKVCHLIFYTNPFKLNTNPQKMMSCLQVVYHTLPPLHYNIRVRETITDDEYCPV